MVGTPKASRTFPVEHEAALSWLAAVLLALFYFLTNMSISQRRLLWFDELNAIRTAKLSDFATFWGVQNSWGGDPAPITYSILTRFAFGLSGGWELNIIVTTNSSLPLAAAPVTSGT